jgi:DNA-binding response OmpR family regulator
MRLLVLETELLMPIIKHMLSPLHYDIDCTCDTAEALQWYNERAPYDIVIMGLLDAKGMSLATHIRRTNPTQIIGLMTGFPIEALSKVWELNIPVLTKPFSAEELIEFINDTVNKTKDS